MATRSPGTVAAASGGNSSGSANGADGRGRTRVDSSPIALQANVTARSARCPSRQNAAEIASMGCSVLTNSAAAHDALKDGWKTMNYYSELPVRQHDGRHTRKW
jgi:hypothetical protein